MELRVLIMELRVLIMELRVLVLQPPSFQRGIQHIHRQGNANEIPVSYAYVDSSAPRPSLLKDVRPAGPPPPGQLRPTPPKHNYAVQCRAPSACVHTDTVATCCTACTLILLQRAALRAH
jgi:hypothetical protein